MRITCKKGLSLLVAILMTVATLPASALADEKTVVVSNNQEISGITTDYEMTDEWGDEDINTGHEVIYNLGSQEITVGYSVDRAVVSPWNYKLFDKNKAYTIQLEDNAFFPYEVQFHVNGNTTVAWFDTQDSTIQIDKYIFSVCTNQNDNNKLAQIGLWINDEYIATRPIAKEFSNPLVMPMSLLPLEEKYVAIDLRGYLPHELTAVKLSALLSSNDINNGPSAVYTKRYWDHNFTILTDENAIMDLSGSYTDSKTLDIQLIVGSAQQLDYNNIRYIVSIQLPTYEDLFEFTLWIPFIYLQTSGVFFSSRRLPVPGQAEWLALACYDIRVRSGYENIIDSIGIVRIDLSVTAAFAGIDVVVYEGFFDTPEETVSQTPVASVETVKGKIIPLTAVMTKNDKTWVYNFNIIMDTDVKPDFPSEYPVFYFYDIAYQSNSGTRDVGIDHEVANRTIYCNVSENTSDPPVTNVVIRLQPGYSSDYEYYIGFRYVPSFNGLVRKAVVGHYNTEADALGATDIGSSLFPINMSQEGTGYKANYKDGVDFTVFVELFDFMERAIQIRIIVTEWPIEPIVQPTDTFFRVNGADGYSSGDKAYVLNYYTDSLYANHNGAYQTVLLLDDKADLSDIRPTFWTNQGIEMYVSDVQNSGATDLGIQISGVSKHNFSNSPILYTARALDGRSIKNYYVKFEKAEKGRPVLFVNGPDKREVFLDVGQAYELHHDIFVANLGDQTLTGLRVDWLEPPQNVRIDDYWTFGSGNNELEGFTTVNVPGINFGEIPNVAKIRLLPSRLLY